MIEIKRILCPVDFSDCSRRALAHATRLAGWYGSEITVLHVFAISAPPTVLSEYPAITRLAAPAKDELIEQLRAFAASITKQGVGVSFAVAEGTIVPEILAHAESGQADLIVVGTHGASGFERLFLGSVAEKLLRKAPCPVMTVPPGAERVPPGEAVVYRNILCPVDFSASSMRALSFALSLAEEAEGRLTLLHVLEWFGDTESQEYSDVSVPEYRRLVERDARERLRAAVPDEARHWCEADEVMASGKPPHEILRLAGERDADLIVLGVQGRGALDLLLFGSTTNHVVRGAECPVLTIRASPGG